jgi:hypothetical protein
MRHILLAQPEGRVRYRLQLIAVMAAAASAAHAQADARFESWNYPTGYRLTPAGWAALSARRRYSYAELHARDAEPER